MAVQEPKNIVIIDWSMIGDLIMLSPCVRAVSERYPDAHLAILGQPSSISTYKHHPAVNQLITYDRSRGDYDLGSFRRTVHALRAGRFDLAFIFHNSYGSALMAFLGKVKNRVGYRYECRDLLLNKRFRLSDKRQHLIETKADLLRLFGITVDNLKEEVFIDKSQASKWIRSKLGPNLGRNRPIVAIGMGATMGYKRWTARGLNSLLNSFPVNCCDFVFVGGPGEEEIFEGVYSYNNTVVDLVGQTTLEELTWVLDKVDLYIGPDSGPMHLAVGRDTPVVALFGPTDPAKCGPYQYDRSVAIRSQKICKECDKRFGKQISQCLHTIEIDEVYMAAIGLLANYCERWNLDMA